MSDADRASALQSRYEETLERVRQSARGAGRDPSNVTLVAVSKTWPASDLRALYDAGVRDFGESYAQEWEEKRAILPEDIRWHFIGHLQSNKARALVGKTHLIHSADRKSLMKELNRRAEEPVEVLLQVNVGEDENKSGVGRDGVFEALELATRYENLAWRGLMTIPPLVSDAESNRHLFAELRDLLEPCQGWLREHIGDRAARSFDQISMGMSGDFEIAIQEGATIVRVGSAIFGRRQYT